MNLLLRSRHVHFGLLVAGLVAGYILPLQTLSRFVLDPNEEHYSHILLIPFVVAYLLYTERKAIFTDCAYHAGWGIGLSLAGLSTVGIRFTVGNSLALNDSLSLTIFSFFLFWLAAFIFCYGPSAFRRGMFPVLFLVLIVPIPSPLLDHAIRFLQYQSAEATALLFTLTGSVVFRDGLTFSLPGVTIHVAEECSSIRSSLALFITGLLAAHLFLRTNSRRWVLILAAIPLAVLKNGIRIVTLTLLSVHVDPSFLTGPAHRRGGFMFFSISLVLYAFVLWPLRRSEAKKLGFTADAASVKALIPESE